MDVYSFGLLCLWLVFRKESLVETDSIDVKVESAFSRQDRSAWETLQALKPSDMLLERAVHLVAQRADINEDTRTRLQQIVLLLLSKDVEKRAPHMQSFVDLLCGSGLGYVSSCSHCLYRATLTPL